MLAGIRTATTSPRAVTWPAAETDASTTVLRSPISFSARPDLELWPERGGGEEVHT